MIKAGRIAMRRRTAVTFPGVQSDMMMITTSREKRRLLPVALREFESQHITIECNCAFKVGNLQMHVADSHIGMDCFHQNFSGYLGCVFLPGASLMASALISISISSPN